MDNIMDSSTLLRKTAASLIDPEIEINQEVLDNAEMMIMRHQIFAQLQWIAFILNRLEALPKYMDALDETIDELDTKDIYESPPEVRIRYISALNQATKITIDIINSMMASKDAVGILVSQLKENLDFSIDNIEVKEEDIIEKLRNMKPEERQKLVGAVGTVLSAAAKIDKE